MNWQRKIDVTINKGDDGRDETTATLLRSVASYGDYGPMAEYETASGFRFWIVQEYMQECMDKKLLPDIPMEVITRNAEIRDKIEYGQAQLNKQPKRDSALILPDGYDV